MKNLTVFVTMLIIHTHFAFAQFGEIHGIVTDHISGEPLVGATVVYSVSGKIKGTTTNEKGAYKIKPLVPGAYELSFSYVTYNEQIINTVIVSADKITFVNVKLSSDLTLPPVTISTFEKPLIDPGIIQTMQIIGAEEIEQSVSRDPVSMVASTAGVYQRDDGGSINVRGSRSNATIYVVDGIKMVGGFSLPKSAIQEISVITGGIPAMFGDATGGVVLITTKSYKNRK